MLQNVSLQSIFKTETKEFLCLENTLLSLLIYAISLRNLSAL